MFQFSYNAIQQLANSFLKLSDGLKKNCTGIVPTIRCCKYFCIENINSHLHSNAKEKKYSLARFSWFLNLWCILEARMQRSML